jgi:predicted dehydrogenase
LNFGVIGYGYWGRNMVRDLATLDSSQVLAICDVESLAWRRSLVYV